MKTFRFIPAVVLSAGLLFNSCIREEAPNMEADIESVTIANAESLLQTEPVVEDNTVTFRIKEFPGNYLFAPEFKLSDGATISPASGTIMDFSEPRKYTVTSQDGAWKKEYIVTFVIDNETIIKGYYPFENVDIVSRGKYHDFYELIDGNKVKEWSNANSGYSLSLLFSGQTQEPTAYPTYQISDGYRGNAVRLVTKDTGATGRGFGSPLAAGNFFLGTFSLNVFSPLSSTKFGIPYTIKKAPKSIIGYYRYKAGEDFQNNSGSSALTKDTWNAYAILFEKADRNNYLLGDHNFADARMVSVAKLKDADRKEASGWTKFEFPFEFVSGKSFDPTKEYMFTIVFTSSIEGDKFNGAVGSTLDIDEVQIITE